MVDRPQSRVARSCPGLREDAAEHLRRRDLAGRVGIGVPTVRDVLVGPQVEPIPDPSQMRCKHVLTTFEHLCAIMEPTPESRGHFRKERDFNVLKRLGIAMLVLSVLVAGLAGGVLAQDDTPQQEELCPFGEACGGFGRGGYSMGGFGYAGSMPTLLAEALGMTTEELFAAQTAGQTVAEIAAAQGVELADVVAAVVAPRAERLTQAVAEGTLTQEQADAMLAAMTEQMTLHFENEGVQFGGGCGMGRGGRIGTSDDTGSFGGWGRRGGMRGGRWSAPAPQNSDA